MVFGLHSSWKSEIDIVQVWMYKYNQVMENLLEMKSENGFFIGSLWVALLMKHSRLVQFMGLWDKDERSLWLETND